MRAARTLPVGGDPDAVRGLTPFGTTPPRRPTASSFQGSAPVTGTGAQAYVNAVDEVFANLMSDLVAWVTAALADVPPPPSPESTEAQPG